MHFTKPIILALASLTSLASAQEYLHPHALQARAFDAGYQAGLEARWAEPEPYADAEAEAGSREDYISDGTVICRRQLDACIHANPAAHRQCQDAYNGCVNHLARGITAKGSKKGGR